MNSDASEEPSGKAVGKLIKGSFERLNNAAAQHLLGGAFAKEHVTAPHRKKVIGRGRRRPGWLMALSKLAMRCRDALCRNAHVYALDRDFGSWEDNDSQLLRVCANARQIEDAIVSGDVKAVYALVGHRFTQHREEAFNALQGDSHTAYEPSR